MSINTTTPQWLALCLMAFLAGFFAAAGVALWTLITSHL